MVSLPPSFVSSPLRDETCSACIEDAPMPEVVQMAVKDKNRRFGTGAGNKARLARPHRAR
jgi:hypothetical protein